LTISKYSDGAAKGEGGSDEALYASDSDGAEHEAPYEGEEMHAAMGGREERRRKHSLPRPEKSMNFDLSELKSVLAVRANQYPPPRLRLLPGIAHEPETDNISLDNVKNPMLYSDENAWPYEKCSLGPSAENNVRSDFLADLERVLGKAGS